MKPILKTVVAALFAFVFLQLLLTGETIHWRDHPVFGSPPSEEEAEDIIADVLVRNYLRPPVREVEISHQACQIVWTLHFDQACTSDRYRTSVTYSIRLSDFRFPESLDTRTRIDFQRGSRGHGTFSRLEGVDRFQASDHSFLLQTDLISTDVYELTTFCGEPPLLHQRFRWFDTPIRGEDAHEFEASFEALAYAGNCAPRPTLEGWRFGVRVPRPTRAMTGLP